MSEKAWTIRKNLKDIIMEKMGDREVPVSRDAFELLQEYADEPPEGRPATEDDISSIVESVKWQSGLRFDFPF